MQVLLDQNPCLLALDEPELQAYIISLLCDMNALIAAGGVVGGATFLSGHGSPEASVTGVIRGQTYTDLDAVAPNMLYAFKGTPGGNTGWALA